MLDKDLEADYGMPNGEENGDASVGACDTVLRYVSELCADYDRRERVIKERSATYRVIMTYKFLNYRILEAARSVAGDRDAPVFIKEIGAKTDYTRSETALSELTYKMRKLEVRIAIATALGLVDSAPIGNIHPK